MTDEPIKERIKSACLQCQKRKKRCDGEKPSCGNCAKGKASCHYTERRPRGPGKKKNRIEHLETRLMGLESALRLKDPALNQVEGNEATGSEETLRAPQIGLESGSVDHSSARNNFTPYEPTHQGVLHSSDSQAGLKTIDLTAASPNLLLTTPLSEGIPTAAQVISKFSEFTQDVSMGYRWMRAQENRGAYPTRVFARLPTYQQVFSLIEPMVEKLQQHGAVITIESFTKLMAEQYQEGPDCYADNPARWAIVNSFFATAMLNRCTTDFVKEIMPMAWNYFKNAFSMFPELITQGRDVAACEALVAMAMFSQSIADTQLTLQITAALTRLVQTLGLNRSRSHLSLDPLAAQRHRRVFWAAYILDVDAVEKYDLSPSVAAEDLPATFEYDDSPLNSTNSENFDSLRLLRWRAQLALIQRRIHERLDPAKTRHMKDDERLKIVRSMDEQLQGWKTSLPEWIWLKQNDDESDFALFLANLHCAFYNSMSKVHMALVHLRSSERLQIDHNLALGEGLLEAEIHKSWDTCAVSARNMIEVVVNLESQTLFQLWGILCYPLSAVLMLLSVILQNPSSETVQDDLCRIKKFVGFLKGIADNGYDVNRLLNACIELRDVAASAISTSQAGEQPENPEAASTQSDKLAQLNSICLKLFRVEDWVQLAQGFLSNLPFLRVEAEEVLSDISGLGTSQEAYGLFVPELLKSQNHHFSCAV